MKPADLERWALRVIDHVRNRQTDQDQRVELKLTWPTGLRAARRIAALCNAARCDDVMFLVGVGEDGAVENAPINELSSWWDQVSTYFDGHVPNMVPTKVHWEDKVALALWFDASHAPYVVKTSGGGELTTDGEMRFVDREVPWREGNKTRSAKRHERNTQPRLVAQRMKA